VGLVGTEEETISHKHAFVVYFRNRRLSRIIGIKGGYFAMKKIMSVAFVLLLAAVLAAGVGISSASAAGGPPVKPYWFQGIDAQGQFVGQTDADTQNSAQYVIYDSNNGNFIITFHPNYDPDGDNPDTADFTTVISVIQVFNGTTYEDCSVAGAFVVPDAYLLYTPVANLPYLQFNVTFTKYDNTTGALAERYTYPVAYLDLHTVLP
jgi:hypothetical protein